MKIKQEQVEAVVAEASKRMSEANYSAVMVGGFVQSQTPTAQYISAHADELGGAEAVVGVIFHAALLGVVFARAAGRSLRAMSYEDLDATSGSDALERLAAAQPSVSDFIVSNVEHKGTQALLAHIALAMDRVC